MKRWLRLTFAVMIICMGAFLHSGYSLAAEAKSIDVKKAHVIAEAALTKASGDIKDVVVQDDRTIERPFGWVFFGATKKYIKSHSPADNVAGLGPVYVNRMTGQAKMLSASLAPADAIAGYERAWLKSGKE